jgi:hypothetical protein
MLGQVLEVVVGDQKVCYALIWLVGTPDMPSFLLFSPFCERFSQVRPFGKISKNGPRARRHGPWR